MNYLTLFFRDRTAPSSIPISEEEATRVRALFDRDDDKPRPLNFIEVTSIVEHHIWVNLDHLQAVRILWENDELPFDPRTIGQSTHYPRDHSGSPGLEDVRWGVTFWLQGRTEPLEVLETSGHDWNKISTSCQSDPPSYVIEDEDGEDLALMVDEIDLIVGVELDRYSEEQLDALAKMIQS